MVSVLSTIIVVFPFFTAQSFQIVLPLQISVDSSQCVHHVDTNHFFTKTKRQTLLYEGNIEAERAKSTFIHSETVRPGVLISSELKSIIVSTNSEFQKIEIVENSFGKVLLTDGKTQSAQYDEFIYHESLVHPALILSGLLSSKPRTVFIGGGGELATAREVLRHKSVERVVMVDLDGKVIDLCKEFLHEWGGDKVSSSPRLELVIGDAYAYLTNCNEKFDVIIMDISDPIEAGPGIMLYTQEFYRHVKTLLNTPNGVFVTQAGIADSYSEADDYDACFAPIKNTLDTIFDCVIPSAVFVPSYASTWGFAMAFMTPKSSSTTSLTNSFTQIETNRMDKIISESITEIEDVGKDTNARDGSEVMKFYDGESHHLLFSLPKHVRQWMAKDTRVMTKDDPIFMY